MKDELEFDYVVVGGGAAGCVLAGRLSENPNTSVLLLEAGGGYGNPWLHIPIGYAKVYGRPKYFWRYATEPETFLDGSPGLLPQAKVLGGGSTINGMVYIRGQREDYDHWRQLGNVGWDADSVLHYFKKSENQTHGASAFHGSGGPLTVSDITEHNELCEGFIKSAEQCGIARNLDFNGATQEGAGYYQTTTHNGRRVNDAMAFVRPASGRKNLLVLKDALVERVLFRGKTAVGVSYNRDGHSHRALCRREVIVAAGAIGSPLLLQRSGIGPAETLITAGISPLVISPSVGKNLRNHYNTRFGFRVNKPHTLNDATGNIFRRIKMGGEYIISRSGFMAGGPCPAGAFIRSGPESLTPDVQVHFTLFSMDRSTNKLDNFSGVSASVCPLRPESHGSVEIRGPDLTHEPSLRFNYLSAEADRRTMVLGMRKVLEIMSAPAMRAHVIRVTDFDQKQESDNDLLEYARTRRVPAHHVTSTCRMGIDELAVVDPRLRVKGVDRLRVVDGSIMPRLVSGNTHAPVIMIAEKGAAMIREDERVA